MTQFAMINTTSNTALQPDQLSLGLVAPLESYVTGPVPTMMCHFERVQMAEALGFSAVWLCDMPFNVPLFGDAGQMFDHFTYLGVLASQTSRIAPGVASITLPLRHPAHVTKAAASVEVLAGGCLLLGVASGVRPEEYPATNKSLGGCGDRFRDSFDYIRSMAPDYPAFKTAQGMSRGAMDIWQKSMGRKLPLSVTGGRRRRPDWAAHNSVGWITCPRNANVKAKAIADFRARVAVEGGSDKPVMQSLNVDLVREPDAAPRPIHLRFQSGVTHLRRYLEVLQEAGVNHVSLNLQLNSCDTETTMKRQAEKILPARPIKRIRQCPKLF
ncbi:LLM class flavin-dependent oxidoreductase [Sulfitobacter sp. F26169L]|uniref:LLM class flavin-dependent oxidoreductase n=1 Tax=Sulfitobacter sp. F26169L TaxID=2996015 RepID=UPI0022609363|nr:LLM class flavin-dependent oxidoreductase [Sulfitobacter sp. F26169L]MCX7567676.1 LLM class flavin-dependent oxidoreductase [Sulfitobacter sp. F26169L]